MVGTSSAAAPGYLAREAPKNPSDGKVALLHEMAEALTALGNYLAVAQHEAQHQPQMQEVSDALQKSFGQYERAALCIRRLRQLFFREDSSNNDRHID
jgi:phosphoglycerate-specific signal transduction histidine kinase